MSHQPEDALRLRERDADAWDVFYRGTCRRTYRVLYQVTSATDSVLEELQQDVWLSAIESIEQFDAARGTASDWILGIARFKGLTHLRKRYSSRVVAVGSSFDLPPSSKTESDSEEEAERAAVLRASIESLPENWQFVLRQKYETGLSVRQIAELTDTTPKATESTLSRARQRLRDLYRETLQERPET